MHILISTKMPQENLRSWINVAKVFSYAGHDVTVWDGVTKSPFDIFDECKPAVFINSGLTDIEKRLCEEYETKLYTANGSLWADLFIYRPHRPTQEERDLFGCDNCIIINDDRSEIKRVEYLLGADSLKTKLFSQYQYMYPQYCQAIPENLYSVALSCSLVCYATNFLNFFNFTLVNKNTYYPLYSKTDPISRDDILEKHTAFHGAKEISDKCDLGIDFTKVYSNFMETYSEKVND